MEERDVPSWQRETVTLALAKVHWQRSVSVDSSSFMFYCKADTFLWIVNTEYFCDISFVSIMLCSPCEQFVSESSRHKSLHQCGHMENYQFFVSSQLYYTVLVLNCERLGAFQSKSSYISYDSGGYEMVKWFSSVRINAVRSRQWDHTHTTGKCVDCVHHWLNHRHNNPYPRSLCPRASLPLTTLSLHTHKHSGTPENSVCRHGEDNVWQISSCGRQMLPLQQLALHKSYHTLTLCFPQHTFNSQNPSKLSRIMLYSFMWRQKINLMQDEDTVSRCQNISMQVCCVILWETVLCAIYFNTVYLKHTTLLHTRYWFWLPINNQISTISHYASIIANMIIKISPFWAI